MKVAWTVVVVMVALVTLTEGFPPRRILFGRCSPDEPVPRAVFMTCANRHGVCELRMGQSHNLRAIFRSQINSTDVNSYVRWNSFVELPLPEQRPDACDGEIQCPVIAGQLTDFTYSLHIKNFWLRNEYPVIWSLTDNETDEPIICFKFKINIV
ncbi:NPC intracellular cholesterol transporter 2 [Chionoecetes opilio]|uniref:NPC intracellular cholesterol transporter 2 n=1 Tax=Chionoecetes opilio TaxID=41210 RepID=A0A8J4YNE1_CHIOP|nr:NPC intracellular cholesterol transporter 2 [Chionoecetes opilio]